MSGIGDEFQRQTAYSRGRMLTGVPSRERPEPFKSYPGAPRIALAAPEMSGGAGLWGLLHERRSVRSYHPGAHVTAADLSQLLWATAGTTRDAGNTLLRTAPSAGARYPIETYIAAHNVTGIAEGLYHYQVPEHALAQLATGDRRLDVSRAALDQGMAADADLVLIWSAVFGRSRSRYAERAYRYVYLDAGHIAQNAALAAVALGLGSCQIAALYDDEANALLGLDGRQESVIYMTAVGVDATTARRPASGE
jgi:SagB-type dehydrogenase family enzyme